MLPNIAIVSMAARQKETLRWIRLCDMVYSGEVRWDGVTIVKRGARLQGLATKGGVLRLSRTKSGLIAAGSGAGGPCGAKAVQLLQAVGQRGGAGLQDVAGLDLADAQVPHRRHVLPAGAGRD